MSAFLNANKQLFKMEKEMLGNLGTDETIHYYVHQKP